MFINVIRSHRDIVAICDKELIGKKFEENLLQLDVKESFYKGEEVSKEKALEILRNMKKEDATFNIVGKKSIETAKEAEIITEDLIGKVQNIPFALLLI